VKTAKGTWSERKGDTVTRTVTPQPPQPKTVTPNVTQPPQVVTPSVTVAHPVTQMVTPGYPCPTCGQKVPLSPAEKQRRYRERQRGS